MISVDIFIRSYYKDLRWLGWCLKSIEKYAYGFRRTILVMPSSSEPRLLWSGLGKEVTTYLCNDFHDDYLGQQVTKMHADRYTDADFICHVDSDCLFRRPVTPEDLISNGRAVLLAAAYNILKEEMGWRRLSELFMGREVEFDFMRRQPFVYPRWLYSELREYTLRTHEMTLSDYIVSRPRRGFSEYNAMGSYAYYHRREDFVWVYNDCARRDESLCRWFWSWNGISAEDQREINAILA
jgi:hypothetical protein